FTIHAFVTDLLECRLANKWCFLIDFAVEPRVVEGDFKWIGIQGHICIVRKNAGFHTVDVYRPGDAHPVWLAGLQYGLPSLVSIFAGVLKVDLEATHVSESRSGHDHVHTVQFVPL